MKELNEKVELGQRVTRYVHTMDASELRIGTVIYVNEDHAYYMVLFPLSKGSIRECYKYVESQKHHSMLTLVRSTDMMYLR